MEDKKILNLDNIKVYAKKSFEDLVSGNSDTLYDMLESIKKIKNPQVSDIFKSEFEYNWKILQFNHFVKTREFFEIDNLSIKNGFSYFVLWSESLDRDLKSYKEKNPTKVSYNFFKNSVDLLKDLIKKTQDISVERYQKLSTEIYFVMNSKKGTDDILSVIFNSALAISYWDILDSNMKEQAVSQIYSNYIREELEKMGFYNLNKKLRKIEIAMKSTDVEEVNNATQEMDKVKQQLEDLGKFDEDRMLFTIFLVDNFGLENTKKAFNAKLRNTFIRKIADILVDHVVIKKKFDNLNERLGNSISEEHIKTNKVVNKI